MKLVTANPSKHDLPAGGRTLTRSSLIGAAIILALVTPLAVAGAFQTPARSSEAARAAGMDKVAQFVLRPRMMTDLTHGAARFTYPHRLQRPDHIALEQRCPGIAEAMATAVAEQMDSFRESFLARWRSRVIAHWNARISDTQLAAIARMIDDPLVRADWDRSITFRSGDTMTSAIDRSNDRTVDVTALTRLQTLTQQFGHADLILDILDYRDTTLRQMNEELLSGALGLLSQGAEAGNRFARIRCLNLPEPFPNGAIDPSLR